MFHNYLKIALRNLFRNSVYSFINIGGLAVGIACSLLILLWVWDEVSYDRFHKNADRLGQLMVNDHFTDKIATSPAVPLGSYENLKTFDNRIKSTSIAHWPYKHLLKVGDKKIIKNGQFASHEFLSSFQFPLLKGDAADVLHDPTSIVINESIAKELFGDKDPINRFIQIDNKYELKVTGVLKDLPSNSTFDFEFLAPWGIYATQDWVKNNLNDWHDESFQVYVEVQEGTDIADLNSSLTKLIREKRGGGDQTEMFIHPLTDWRLRSNFKDGKQIGGMIDYVKTFTTIALFILVIACINFMNLATARSERRAREVGIRKSIGSRRAELIGQFIGESILISALAFIAALVIVELLLPLYNNLVNKNLEIDFSSPYVWMFSLAFILITGFFAGSYPAFYLSSFNPVKVLKGNTQAGRSAVAPRKILVSLQFFFSIFLIVGTIVVYEQIQYVKNRDTGYDRENLMMVTANEEMGKNFTTIEKELLASGVVKSLTVSSSPITEIYGNNVLDWPGKPAEQSILFSRVVTGYNYTKTLGIKMAEGRDFSEDFKSDSSAMLLNKAAVDAMGLKNPVGAMIGLWDKKWKVVGVVEDVLMASPFREVQPGFFLLNPQWGEVVTMRIEKTNDFKATLSKIESVFKKNNPSYPFEYQFVDQQFEKKFSSINLIGTLASLFAFLAIFITCLGLFGLATFTAEQRTKEIGIRKVMGASTSSIVSLLSKDFTRLVIIGFVIAAPISWWVMNNYLDRWPYRIEISWWIIPIAGAVALLLTLMIVSSQAMRAASLNPSESLRSE